MQISRQFTTIKCPACDKFVLDVQRIKSYDQGDVFEHDHFECYADESHDLGDVIPYP